MLKKKEKSGKSIRINGDAPMPEKKKKKKSKTAELPSEEPRKKKKKKRLAESDDVSDVPRKKKKKKLSTSTALAVVDDKPKDKTKSLSKAKSKQARLQAKIDSELAQIEVMPVVNSQEQQQLDEYLHMFRKLAKLIRKAEKQCMKSGQSRDYYALCTLMSQQREVIADIRSVSDMSGQVAAMESDVLQPMLRALGQNALDGFYQFRKLLIATCKSEETQFAIQKLTEITQDQAKFMQGQYVIAAEKTNKILLG